jgi:predicted CXXCH cytochrome family protein
MLRRWTAAATGAWLLAVLLVSCADREERSPAPGATDTGDVALATWRSFYVPDPNRIPHDLATNPGTPWGDYVGSSACATCHPVEHGKWRNSFHSRTLYDARPETVFGRFDGAIVDDPQSPYIVSPTSEKDPSGNVRFRMLIRLRPDWPKGRSVDTYGAGLPDLIDGEYEVIYAFGNRRHQPYVAKGRDGKHWALPIFWNDVEKRWRYSGFRPYVRSCAGCHVTGIKHSDTDTGFEALGGTHPIRWNLAPADEGWAEGAVGCEVCHGPGRAHVEAVERVGIETYRRQRREGAKGPTIFSGRTSQELMTLQCDQCHDFFTESTVTWVPGPEGFDGPPWKEPIVHKPGDPRTLSQFYADGSHKSPCSMGTVFRSSKMFHAGIKCTDCHDPHGNDDWADLTLPVAKNELCLSCHGEAGPAQARYPTIEAQTAHSRHAADSPGNLCVECHMPRHMIFSNGQQMMSERLPKHDFSIPTGERRPGGPPPSCNVCHVDRDDAWTRDVLRAWREGGPVPR